MNRKSFLDELKVLLRVNLEPSEVKSAYQYYSELFDEEDEDALISRLGSPPRGRLTEFWKTGGVQATR